MATAIESIRQEWVKLVFNETPTKVVVKKGYLYDEGDFYKVIGDRSESLVRKDRVISITKKKSKKGDKK
jgi:hypothetical protein